MPVLSDRAFREVDHDVVLIGSSALAINDGLQAESAEIGLERPVVRMCDYDDLPRASG